MNPTEAAVEVGALLVDPAGAGAYYIDLDDRAALVEAATLHGFAVASIDMRACSDADDALERFARELRFPAWFGGNWDALADCLADLSWWPAPGYVLVLDHVDDWQAHAPSDCALAIDILGEAATRWASGGTPFWALLPLPAHALPDA